MKFALILTLLLASCNASRRYDKRAGYYEDMQERSRQGWGHRAVEIFEIYKTVDADTLLVVYPSETDTGFYVLDVVGDTAEVGMWAYREAVASHHYVFPSRVMLAGSRFGNYIGFQREGSRVGADLVAVSELYRAKLYRVNNTPDAQPK